MPATTNQAATTKAITQDGYGSPDALRFMDIDGRSSHGTLSGGPG